MPPASQIDIIGVVGTGAMGRGIAQIAAQAGIEVLLFDLLPGAASMARDSLVASLTQLAEKGKISTEASAQAESKLQVVATLQELAAAQLVIEAIVENLEAKRQLFADLEAIVSSDCLLASNTSSLSITALAATCTHPERLAGMHFFNPVPLMKVVEVIAGLATAPRVSEALLALGQRLGHTAVAAQDTPGFIVNHAGRGLTTEALRCLGECVAPFNVIDAIMRETVGLRMGPFELLDLTGLDVSQPVMEAIYHQYYEEPRYRPSPLAAQRLAGGLLGRKTGRGFYAYQGERALPLATDSLPAAAGPAPKLWVSRQNPQWGDAVSELVLTLGGELDDGALPTSDALCLVTPLGEDASSACLAQGLDAARTLAIDCLYGLAKHRTLMTTPLTTLAMRDAAQRLFAADGVPLSTIADSAGFVAQRITAMMVNIACDIAQQGIAQPLDIDRAVRLGLGYPLGPLSLGDRLGADKILAILLAMQEFYGDPRYRPSPWLTRRARLGVSLFTVPPR